MKIIKLSVIQRYIKENKKKSMLFGGGAAALLLIVILIIAICASSMQETVTYRETEAVYGNLVVGITKEGNTTVGTKNQTMDLDISAYTSSTEFSWDSMGGQGGMMMGGMMSGGTSDTSTTSSSSEETRQLEIEEVLVSVGQRVEEGASIVRLNAESVAAIRASLEEDANSAKITYDQVATDNQLTVLSAEQELETNQIYGSYSQTEYDSSMKQLQDAVDTAQEDLETAKEELVTLQEEAATLQSNVAAYQKLYDNAVFTVENTDKETALYWWVVAENAREDAETMLEDLEDSITQNTEDTTAKETEIEELDSTWQNAVKALELGQIQGSASYQEEMLYYNNAQEIYDVTIAQAELEEAEAKDDYETAQTKLDEFDAYISEDCINAAYSGVITGIDAAAGDVLYTGSSLLTINSYDDVTIEISLEEDDRNEIALDDITNISFSSFPDTQYEGTITDIGDATYNSNTGTNDYTITVTVNGDVSALYEGMSAEVTFITRESEEVLYISNRAVIRENGSSYVKIKDEKGNIVTKEVETGFSDGIDVEIKEGLSEGDVVLIESKVSDS